MDKEGGLIVDYVGIASTLKQAMHDYTMHNGKNDGDMSIASIALKKFEEKLEIRRDLLHGCNYSAFTITSNLGQAKLISGAMDFIIVLKKEKRKENFIKQVQILHKCDSFPSLEGHIRHEFVCPCSLT